MSLYPIFLKLEGRKVLVVGGGSVAEQKIEGVLRSARDVTVMAPQVNERIRLWAEQGWVKHLATEDREGMAQGYFLVITCTDSEAVNRADRRRQPGAGPTCAPRAGAGIRAGVRAVDCMAGTHACLAAPGVAAERTTQALAASAGAVQAKKNLA